MAKSLLAASAVEAAGEGSRLALLYLQHYATGVYKGIYKGVYKGVYAKVKAEQVVANSPYIPRYARRSREEQHAPLNLKRRILQQAQNELTCLSTPTLLQCHARKEHMSTRAVP